MQFGLILTALAFSMILFCSCKKENGLKNECFPNTALVRQISNAHAIIKETNGRFYLIEQGSIDTKLNPCILDKEFRVNNLQVIISGDVKSTIQTGYAPCCVENFVITRITK